MGGPTGITRGFPRSLTSFVGRADEVDRLMKLLAMHRLVTVIGPGGVGKTRLTAEVTHRLSDRFAERIWLVELAAVSAPHQVAPAIAARVCAQQQSDRPVPQAVADVLAGAPALLVLDNCEHVVGAVADFCNELLAHCDDVVVLATSREPIGVAGESRMRLLPLAAGVALFVDRVRLSDPAFEPSEQSTALASQIVRRLDGLPLAIELAAARVESLGMEQLHARLAEPFRVLTQGPRTGPARQRSLRATVDWSYRLMSDPLQRVLRRLSVFPGSFTLQAAETVGGSDAELAVLHLVDCSLLTPPHSDPNGGPRYLMLDTVRAFAHEQLDEAGERADAEFAMIDFAVQTASAAAAAMRSAGGEAAGAARFDAEQAVLGEAVTWALQRDAEAALRLAVALAPWWQLRGRAVAGYPLLDRALSGFGGRDDLWRAAHKWLGRLAHSTAAYRAALTHFSTLCASIRTDAPSADLVDGLAGKSGSLRNLGMLAEAGDAARVARDLARRLDYAEGEALAVTQLSLVASYTDDTEMARRLALEAGQIDVTRLPDKVARRVGLTLTVALADSDEVDAARDACARGLESARAAGDVTMLADFLYFTTHIALRAERLDDAGAHIVESLQLTAQSGDSIRVLDCLDDCARLCAVTGRPAEAITLWAAHAAGVASLGTPALAQDARHREGPRRGASRVLGAGATHAAERRGAQMNLRTAAEFAAMLAGSAPPTTDTSGATRLTPRERDLLVLVAGGRTDAQIADELFISIRTVRSHLDRIRDKSGSRRRADLTRLALRVGLV